MKQNMRIFTLSLLLTFGLASVALAGTSISGDVIEYDFGTGQAVGTGKIVVTRTDGYTIHANSARYNTKTENGELTGNVVATNSKGSAVGRELYLRSGSLWQLRGNARITQDGNSLQAAGVDYQQLEGIMNTVGAGKLTLKDGSVLTANGINYVEPTAIATATGNVQINSKVRKMTGSADKAIYKTKVDDGNIELIGNARATQDGNTVRGNRLILRGTNKDRIAEGFGNVELVYVPRKENEIIG